MADNHFDLVIVWDNLGGAVRVNAGGKATVTDPATGDLVTVVQDGQSVSTITADSNGRVSFVAQQGTVKLIAGGLAMIAVSAEQATAGAENAAAAQAAQVATEAARDDVITGLAAKLDKTAAPGLRPGNRMAYLGDSITQASWLPTSQGASYPLFAGMLSGGRLTTVVNAGKSGDNSTQALARFDTDVTPHVPGTVFVLLGTNDAGQSVTFATYSANVEAIVAKTRAIGAVPVLGTIPPNNGTSRHAAINTWNAWLRQYAAEQGITIVDVYRLLVDPANGNYAAGYDSGDGTHPNLAGYLAIGQLISDTLSPLVPDWRPYLSQDNADPINGLSSTNSVTLTDSNADGVADGWFAYGGSSGYAHALVTDPEVPGGMQQITQTANASTRVIERSVSGWGAGDTLRVTGVVTSDGGVTAQVKLVFVGPGTSAFPAIFTAAITRGAVWMEVVIPEGTTTVNVDLIASAGTGVVSFGQMTVTNQSVLGF